MNRHAKKTKQNKTKMQSLIPHSLGDGLDVAEGSLAGTGGDQSQRLVHAAKRRNVNSLQQRQGVSENEGGCWVLLMLPDDEQHLQSRYGWSPHGGRLAGWQWQEPVIKNEKWR
jgi:hypothetical protein